LPFSFFRINFPPAGICLWLLKNAAWDQSIIQPLKYGSIKKVQFSLWFVYVKLMINIVFFGSFSKKNLH